MAVRPVYAVKRVLEISSKVMQPGGEELSAFFLTKYVPNLNKSIPVEFVFQSGKVFQNGGPYLDLMTATPREVKRDERLKDSGPLLKFVFEGQEFPLLPRTIFYDYIYINALLENKELGRTALAYDAFTDIEFTPKKSINCQARAAATFVSLSRVCGGGPRPCCAPFAPFPHFHLSVRIPTPKQTLGN